eukprot:349801-Chlamydomonas_euryale.AAC.45
MHVSGHACMHALGHACMHARCTQAACVRSLVHVILASHGVSPLTRTADGSVQARKAGVVNELTRLLGRTGGSTAAQGLPAGRASTSMT